MKFLKKRLIIRGILILLIIIMAMLCLYNIQSIGKKKQKKVETNTSKTDVIKVSQDNKEKEENLIETAMYVTIDELNVRSGAGVEYNVVGTVKEGEEVITTNRTENGWSEIRFNGEKGFVFTKYLTDKKPEKKDSETVVDKNVEVDVDKKVETNASEDVNIIQIPYNFNLTSQEGVTLEQKVPAMIKFNRLPENVKKVFIEDGWKIVLVKTTMDEFDKSIAPEVRAQIRFDNKDIVFSLAMNAVEESFYHEFGHFIDLFNAKGLSYLYSNSLEFSQAMNFEIQNMENEYGRSSPQEFWAEVFEMSVLDPVKAGQLFPKSLVIINKALAEFK